MFSRRLFIGSICLAGITRGALLAQKAPPPVDLGEQPNAAQIDEWVTKALFDVPAENAVDGMPVMSRFVEPIWFMEKPISWHPNAGQRNYPPVTVPSGFVTDLASVPWWAWSALPPDGEYAYASIIHDFLYWTQKGSREDADEVLKLCMQDFHVRPITVDVIYNAVRLRGGSSWNDNAALKRAGESRFLKRYPSDPTTYWRDWKKDPSNFY